MKSILIFISILGFSLSVAPTANLITSITSPAKGVIGSNSIIFATATSGWAANDKIVMTTGTSTSGTDPSFEVTSAHTAASLTATIVFATSGTYKVFVKNADGEEAQVAAGATITFVVDPAAPVGPGTDLITLVTATDPKAAVATSFTFTLKTGGLKASDIITLSTSTTAPAPADKYVTLAKDETGATYTDKFTLAAAGDYTVYVTRAGGVSKQAAKAIAVTSSGFISMTLAIVLGLFLF